MHMANSEHTGKDQPSENSNSKNLSRNYDASFVVDDAYREALPDMQNASARYITGANVPILKVGMSNFKLPLNYGAASGKTLNLETAVAGTVLLFLQLNSYFGNHDHHDEIKKNPTHHHHH